MTFRYVKIANGMFEGKRIPIVEVTQKIIDDKHLKSDVMVFPDDQQEPCLLLDIPGAVNEARLVAKALEKFKQIRAQEITPDAISLYALEQLASRFIMWCRNKLYAFRLLFIRASVRVMLFNYAEALDDLNTIFADRGALDGYFELEYLVNHNRAVLLLMQGNPEGLALLHEIYKAYNCSTNNESPQAADEPKIKGGKSPAGNDNSISDVKITASRFILPTIIVIHEVLEKLEMMKKFDSIYNELPLSRDLNKRILNKTAVSLGEKLDNKEDRIWREDLIAWPSEIRWISDKQFMGFALLLDINRDEDHITRVLIEARKTIVPEIYICKRDYFHCQKAYAKGDLFQALGYFSTARKHHLNYDTLKDSKEIIALFSDCRLALINCLKQMLNDCSEQYYDLDAYSSEIGGRIEKDMLKFLSRQFNEIYNSADSLSNILKGDGNSNDCKKLESAPQQLLKEYNRFRFIYDLMLNGYYQQIASLPCNDLEALGNTLNQLRIGWKSRIFGNREPWACEMEDIHQWRTFGRGSWAALTAEYCSNRLKSFLSKKPHPTVAWEHIESAYSAIHGLVAEAQLHLERVKQSDMIGETKIDFQLLKRMTALLIDEINTMINPAMKPPQSPHFVIKNADDCFVRVKKKEASLFPNQCDAKKIEGINCLFALFDQYYPDEIPATCLHFCIDDLDAGHKILKRIEQLNFLSCGMPHFNQFLKRKARLMIIEGWGLMQSRLLNTLERDTIQYAESLFVKALEYHRDAPYALRGLAHLSVMKCDKLDAWAKDAMLHALGHSDADLTSIKSLADIPQSSDKGFLKKYMTRQRLKQFDEVLKCLC